MLLLWNIANTQARRERYLVHSGPTARHLRAPLSSMASLQSFGKFREITTMPCIRVRPTMLCGPRREIFPGALRLATASPGKKGPLADTTQPDPERAGLGAGVRQGGEARVPRVSARGAAP